MRRNRHDGTGAVGGEDVVGDEDRDLGVVDRIMASHAFEPDAGLLLIELRTLEIALGSGLLLIGLHVFGVSDRAIPKPFGDQLVLGRKNHVGRPKERVAASRVDRNRIGRSCRLEVDQRTSGFPDPVALHLLDAVRPI